MFHVKHLSPTSRRKCFRYRRITNPDRLPVDRPCCRMFHMEHPDRLWRTEPVAKRRKLNATEAELRSSSASLRNQSLNQTGCFFEVVGADAFVGRVEVRHADAQRDGAGALLAEHVRIRAATGAV